MAHPCSQQFLAPEKLRGVGGILLNRDGRRFVDELSTRNRVTKARRRAQTRAHVHCRRAATKRLACLMGAYHSSCMSFASTSVRWQIWNGGQTNGAKTSASHGMRGAPGLMASVPTPPSMSPLAQNITAQPLSQAWLLLGSSAAAQFGPALGFYLSKSLFTKHDSLAAAAAHMGVPADTLAAEVQAYNAAAAAGADQFGKTVFPTTIEPAEPVHAALITPVVHYTMVGGRVRLLLASSCHVLTSSGCCCELDTPLLLGADACWCVCYEHGLPGHALIEAPVERLLPAGDLL